MWRKKMQLAGKRITLQRYQPRAEGKSAALVQGTTTSYQRRHRVSMAGRQGRDARERWPRGGGMRRTKDTDGWKAASAGVKEQQQGMREGAG